eukprot:NODE_20_length_44879_cov_0.624654.p11 type:complete len:434 gc:universal NODE_20_length_44879_cov_0.624654:26152-24851(-)
MIFNLLQNYLKGVLSNDGYKVLLLDDYCLNILSFVPMSYFLQHNVFHIGKLPAQTHLSWTAIVMIHPSSLQDIITELQNPHYSQYILCLVSETTSQWIEQIAQADIHERITQVLEFYMDVIALDEYAFNQPKNALASSVGSLLQAFQWSPALRGLNLQLPSCSGQPCVILNLNRSFDYLTPLLHSWYYQAMIHDLIGIENYKINQPLVSFTNDNFYNQNKFASFGDIGVKIKELVAKYQNQYASLGNLNTLQDIKQFINKYPELKDLQANVETHVNVMTILSEIVNKNQLMTIGEIEQSLACEDNEEWCAEQIRKLLSSSINNIDKVRLILLYSVRYNTYVQEFTSSLRQLGLEKYMSLVHLMSTNKTPMNMTQALFKKGQQMMKGLKGIDNVFTQHEPLVIKLINDLIKGRLMESQYPYQQPGQQNLPGVIR